MTLATFAIVTVFRSQPTTTPGSPHDDSRTDAKTISP